MILDQNLKIKITKKNIDYYKIFFDDLKLKDIIDINTELHLQKNSNIQINVACDICGTKRYIKYQAYTKNINSCEEYPIYTCDKCSHIKLKNYNMKHYGVEYYSQHPDRNGKCEKTCLDKYGVNHYSKTKEYKERISKTNLDKFGYENPFMDKNRIKKIFMNKYGVMHPSQVLDKEGNCKFFNWVPLSQKTNWEVYKKDARNKTKQNIKLLNWDGTDFYDGEYIKDNFNLHYLDNNYPTIDHKISIYEGFMKGLSVEFISNIENLCWTKRIINITKNR